MGKPRIAVPRGTLAVTRRTNDRKLLWTPSAPQVHEGYLWPLAMAQEREGFELHHGVLLPTHEHWTMTPGWETDVGEAFRILHRESTRFLQESLLERGYDAPQSVWDGRQTHAMHLVDAGAILEWLLYEHLQAPEAGLVERADDWPGWLSPLGLLRGGVLVLERPDVYFGRRQPTQRELVFTPPPELVRLFGSDLEGVVYWLKKAVEARERQLAKERTRPVVGVERIRRIHPFSEPLSCRERRGQRTPRYKVGRGWLPEQRDELVAQLRGEDRRFLDEHAAAKRRWSAGERDVAFPYGSLQMVTEHAAQVAAPHPDAVLVAPERSVAALGGSIRQLVEQAAEVALEELAEDVDDARDAGVVPDEIEHLASPRAEGGDVEHRHLQSPSRSADRPHPRRLVTLRDQARRRRARRHRGSSSRRGPQASGTEPDT